MHRWSLALLAGAILASAPAQALVGAGARPGDFRVEDPAGKTVRFSSFAGRVVLLMYEDRVAVDWNAALKKRLSRDKSLPRTLVVLPMADMRRWRYWPARNFAQKELQKRSKAAGRPVYGDWNGEAAKALGVVERTSSVLLVGDDGTVRWAAGGRLSAARIDELVALIRGGSSGTRPAAPVREGVPREARPEAPKREPASLEASPEAPASEPETPASEPETPASEPAAPASEPAAPASEPAAPASEPAVPASEPEAPASEPEAVPEDRPAAPDAGPAK